MTQPKCGKCEGIHFTGQVLDLMGFKGLLVFCTFCGTVVGWGGSKN
jgi:hypothetical protein